MVKLFVVPGQLFVDGVTNMVATTTALVVLIGINEGISPTPLAARPMEVLVLFQPKPVPLKLLVKFTIEVADPLQIFWSAG
jgi:hypothetical protein